MNQHQNLNLAFSIFGIAYAAFFVWLVVRIVNRREKWAIKLAIYSGIAFVILAFTTPFVIILYLDMVWRQRFREEARKAAVNPPASTPDSTSESN